MDENELQNLTKREKSFGDNSRKSVQECSRDLWIEKERHRWKQKTLNDIIIERSSANI